MNKILNILNNNYLTDDWVDVHDDMTLKFAEDFIRNDSKSTIKTIFGYSTYDIRRMFTCPSCWESQVNTADEYVMDTNAPAIQCLHCNLTGVTEIGNGPISLRMSIPETCKQCQSGIKYNNHVYVTLKMSRNLFAKMSKRSYKIADKPNHTAIMIQESMINTLSNLSEEEKNLNSNVYNLCSTYPMHIGHEISLALRLNHGSVNMRKKAVTNAYINEQNLASPLYEVFYYENAHVRQLPQLIVKNEIIVAPESLPEETDDMEQDEPEHHRPNHLKRALIDTPSIRCVMCKKEFSNEEDKDRHEKYQHIMKMLSSKHIEMKPQEPMSDKVKKKDHELTAPEGQVNSNKFPKPKSAKIEVTVTEDKYKTKKTLQTIPAPKSGDLKKYDNNTYNVSNAIKKRNASDERGHIDPKIKKEYDQFSRVFVKFMFDMLKDDFADNFDYSKTIHCNWPSSKKEQMTESIENMDQDGFRKMLKKSRDIFLKAEALPPNKAARNIVNVPMERNAVESVYIHGLEEALFNADWFKDSNIKHGCKDKKLEAIRQRFNRFAGALTSYDASQFELSMGSAYKNAVENPLLDLLVALVPDHDWHWRFNECMKERKQHTVKLSSKCTDGFVDAEVPTYRESGERGTSVLNCLGNLFSLAFSHNVRTRAGLARFIGVSPKDRVSFNSEKSVTKNNYLLVQKTFGYNNLTTAIAYALEGDDQFLKYGLTPTETLALQSQVLSKYASMGFSMTGGGINTQLEFVGCTFSTQTMTSFMVETTDQYGITHRKFLKKTCDKAERFRGVQVTSSFALPKKILDKSGVCNKNFSDDTHMHIHMAIRYLSNAVSTSAVPVLNNFFYTLHYHHMRYVGDVSLEELLLKCNDKEIVKNFRAWCDKDNFPTRRMYSDADITASRRRLRNHGKEYDMEFNLPLIESITANGFDDEDLNLISYTRDLSEPDNEVKNMVSSSAEIFGSLC